MRNTGFLIFYPEDLLTHYSATCLLDNLHTRYSFPKSMIKNRCLEIRTLTPTDFFSFITDIRGNTMALATFSTKTDSRHISNFLASSCSGIFVGISVTSILFLLLYCSNRRCFFLSADDRFIQLSIYWFNDTKFITVTWFPITCLFIVSDKLETWLH